jgi:hypothetical protein
MLSIGDKVRVIEECNWYNQKGCFRLLGLDGEVVGVYDDAIFVRFESVGEVILEEDDVEQIKCLK